MFGEVGEDKKHTQLAATVLVQSKTRQTKQGAARRGGEVAAQQVTGDPRRIRSSSAKQQRPLVDKTEAQHLTALHADGQRPGSSSGAAEQER